MLPRKCISEPFVNSGRNRLTGIPLSTLLLRKLSVKMDAAPAAAAIAARKFDITYLVCKEHIAFFEMDSFCQLEKLLVMNGSLQFYFFVTLQVLFMQKHHTGNQSTYARFLLMV